MPTGQWSERVSRISRAFSGLRLWIDMNDAEREDDYWEDTYDRSFKDQFDLARQELSFLPQEDQRWIFGETALTLWPMLR